MCLKHVERFASQPVPVVSRNAWREERARGRNAVGGQRLATDGAGLGDVRQYLDDPLIVLKVNSDDINRCSMRYVGREARGWMTPRSRSR